MVQREACVCVCVCMEDSSEGIIKHRQMSEAAQPLRRRLRNVCWVQVGTDDTFLG